MKKSRINNTFTKPFFITLFYGIVAKLSLTLLLTIITTFTLMRKNTDNNMVSDITDIHNSFAFFASGCAALLTMLILWLGDRARMIRATFWTLPGKRPWELSLLARNELLRGAGTGFLLSAFMILVLWSSGQLGFLGLFFDADTNILSYSIFLANIFGLLALTFCEEYIFRHKILLHLLASMKPIMSIFLTAILFTVVKSIQADLSLVDTSNLILLNLVLGFYVINNNYTIHRAIAFSSSLFLSLFSLMGMPLWNRQGPSILLFRDITNVDSLITGGTSGSMSSLVLTILLVMLLISQYFSWQSKSNAEAAG